MARLGNAHDVCLTVMTVPARLTEAVESVYLILALAVVETRCAVTFIYISLAALSNIACVIY